MIHDHFQATGLCDAAQGLSDLFNICLHDDDVQDFDTRWDQVLLITSEIPEENVFEGWYKMKLQGSAQHQTVLALCDQWMNRDRASQSYQRLRTLVRRHVDQMSRTRNFKARNERIETGVVVKSHKGRNVSVERSGERQDSAEKETLAVSVVVKKHNHPLLLRKCRLTEESLL